MIDVIDNRPSIRQRLAESLQKLMETHPIDKISVKDIVADCGVSKRTFYNYFEDKYALMNWIFESCIVESLRETADSDATMYGFIRRNIHGFSNNSGFFMNWARNASGEDAFLENTTRITVEAMKEYLGDGLSGSKECDVILFDLYYASFAGIAAFRDWHASGRQQDIDEIACWVAGLYPDAAVQALFGNR